MQYFSYISWTYTLKNKLEKDVLFLLEALDRKVLPDQSAAAALRENIIGKIHDVNLTHPRCKPLRAQWTNTDDDYQLILGPGTICHYHLYATKT